jgi:predicted DNA-binding protein
MAKRSEVLSVRITPEEKELLQLVAAERDVPVGQIIREAVKKIIKEERQ